MATFVELTQLSNKAVVLVNLDHVAKIEAVGDHSMLIWVDDTIAHFAESLNQLKELATVAWRQR